MYIIERKVMERIKKVFDLFIHRRSDWIVIPYV